MEYITYLCVPGEPLLSTQGPMATIADAAEMRRWCGLDCVASTLVATPVPRYTDDGYLPDMPSPISLAHPLLWLSPSEACRKVTPGGWMEDDDEWAVRICALMTAAGFYDIPTGRWNNILNVANIDIAQPTHLQRVYAWQHGAPDVQLDALDISGFMDTSKDPTWGTDYASSIMDVLRQQSWEACLDEIKTRAARLDPGMVKTARSVWLVALTNYPGAVRGQWRKKWQSIDDIEQLRATMLADARYAINT